MLDIQIPRVLLVALLAFVMLTGCVRNQSKSGASILLFDGTGTSPNDVAAIANILTDGGFVYQRVDSTRLNRMSQSQLIAYQLIIFPGGNYITMGNNLTAETTRRIHDAGHKGVNYLGICAGGLLAGRAECNSLDLSSGVKFRFYEAVNRGVHKAAVSITCFDEPSIDHYWEDGPQFSGWGVGCCKVSRRNTSNCRTICWEWMGDPLWRSS